LEPWARVFINSTTAEDADLCHENGIGHQQLYAAAVERMAEAVLYKGKQLRM